MSEFYIQQRTLSESMRSIVQDETMRPVYFLTDSLRKGGDKISLYDMKGDLLVEVKKCRGLFGTCYDLFFEQKKIGTLQKQFHFLTQDGYCIKELRWVIHGNIRIHTYQIMQGLSSIMKMYPANTSLGDVYCLEIPEKINAPLAISVAFILDYWVFSGKKLHEKTVSPEIEPA